MSGYVFDYVTGDPDNLTGGGDAAMDDIQGSFFDVRTWLNSGVLGQLAASLLIVGEVRHLAGPPPDATWLPCDGRSLTQSGNVKLFNAIGTTYGPGDTPGSTFNLPDLRGRALVGAGTGPGLTARAVGTKWGVEAVALSLAQIPAHDHGGGDHTHGAQPGAWFCLSDGMSTVTPGVGPYGAPGVTPNTSPSGPTISAQGSNGAHDNTSPSIAVPAYIYAGT